jgi:hypothetical protein
MVGDEELSFALIAPYGPPDTILLRRSHGTLWSIADQPEAELQVIPAKSIMSVVALVPHKGDRLYATEKLGLDVAGMGGIEEDMNGSDKE